MTDREPMILLVCPQQETDRCTYIVALQGEVQRDKLPTLPSNAMYVNHDNECYDLGTVGWILEEGYVDTT